MQYLFSKKRCFINLYEDFITQKMEDIMNKKLMLLGLCLMGTFSAVHADDQPTDTSAVATADKTDDKEQTNEKDCGCGKKG
jgi:hypothetical protein